LSHPLLAGSTGRSSGSHLWIVEIREQIIRQAWKKDSFSVVCHKNQVKPVYVKDVLQYIERLYELRDVLRTMEPANRDRAIKRDPGLERLL
jgi:hypothetical protein